MRMLAAISRKGNKAPVIEEVDIEEPRAGEILVRNIASGICHTDMTVHGRTGDTPIVLGHEGAGVVERVGPGVMALKPGDHVGMSYSFCGTCPSCLHGHPSYCYEVMPRNFGGRRLDGTSPISQGGKPINANFFGQSSFAQFSIAPASSAVKIGKDVPIEMVGPLGCGILTGAGAVLNSFEVKPGESIAVFGAGSVGLSAVMAARLAGASRIIAIDRVASRLQMAVELGATDVIDASAADPVAAVKRLLPWGANWTLNTTLAPAAATQAIECLANRGTMGFVSVPEGGWQPDASKIFSFGRRIQPVLMGDAMPATFIPMLLDYHTQGRFPFDRLVKFYPFEKIAEAFHDSENGTTIKPILRMPH